MGRKEDLEGLGLFVERLEMDRKKYGSSWWEDEEVVHSFCSVSKFTVIKYRDLLGSADALEWVRRLRLVVVRLVEELKGEFEGLEEPGSVSEVIHFLEDIRKLLDRESSYCVGGWDRSQLEEAVCLADDGDDDEFK
jgi:hypothetical protein